MHNELINSLLFDAFTFRRYIPEKVLFIALNIVDMAFTLIAYAMGFKELNPVIASVVAIPWLLILFKVALPVFISWLTPGKWLRPAILLIFLVTVWNAKELLGFLLA